MIKKKKKKKFLFLIWNLFFGSKVEKFVLKIKMLMTISVITKSCKVVIYQSTLFYLNYIDSKELG